MSEGCYSPRFVERLQGRVKAAEEEAQTERAKRERAEEREAACLDMLEQALRHMCEGTVDRDLRERIGRALRDWRAA
mgnify:CR=1 FL=1